MSVPVGKGPSVGPRAVNPPAAEPRKTLMHFNGCKSICILRILARHTFGLLHFADMDFKTGKCLWYFAYGSNMDSDKFTGSRGVVPLDQILVRIPDWVLVMEIPGLPYSEPAFASLRPRETTGGQRNRLPDAMGVAYLITEEQYRGIIASEGGGTAYANIEVTGVGLTELDREKLGSRMLWTLGSSTMTRDPFPAPSARYMVRNSTDH